MEAEKQVKILKSELETKDTEVEEYIRKIVELSKEIESNDSSKSPQKFQLDQDIEDLK
jgi:hypothetical protein